MGYRFWVEGNFSLGLWKHLFLHSLITSSFAIENCTILLLDSLFMTCFSSWKMFSFNLMWFYKICFGIDFLIHCAYCLVDIFNLGCLHPSFLRNVISVYILILIISFPWFSLSFLLPKNLSCSLFLFYILLF